MDLFHKAKELIGLLVLLAACSEYVLSCSISSGWASLQMNERLTLSSIVVYGKTTQHRADVKKVGSKTLSYINAVFEVFCVLKEGEDPVPQEILIEQITPRDGCSGTRQHMQLGTEAIVALQKSYSGNYKYHEVVPTLSATFLPTKATLFSIASTCDLQQWMPPHNATDNNCPVCGVANFTDAVLQSFEADGELASCFFNASLQAGAAGCPMFSSLQFDNTSMCIPAAYGNTCTRLSFGAPTATCECDDTSKIHGGYGDVDTGATIVPGLGPYLLAAFMSLFFL